MYVLFPPMELTADPLSRTKKKKKLELATLCHQILTGLSGKYINIMEKYLIMEKKAVISYNKYLFFSIMF